VNQRWYQRLGTWRDPSEIIDTRAHEVVELLDDTTPRTFVEEHHYSGSYPAARARFGLYQGALLVGVAVFSHPPNEAVLRRLPCERMAGIELGRFVLLSSVAGNGESWFLARCFDRLRAKGIEALVSHSDPCPRRASDGTLVLPGHVGNIYQATNAVYGGRTQARKIWLLPDGTVLSDRTLSKIPARARGYRAAINKLVEHGAVPPLDLGQDLGAWLTAQLPGVARRMRHRGNYRYLWALDRRLRKDVARLAIVDANGDPVAYPKKVDEEAVAA